MKLASFYSPYSHCLTITCRNREFLCLFSWGGLSLFFWLFFCYFWRLNMQKGCYYCWKITKIVTIHTKSNTPSPPPPPPPPPQYSYRSLRFQAIWFISRSFGRFSFSELVPSSWSTLGWRTDNISILIMFLSAGCYESTKASHLDGCHR